MANLPLFFGSSLIFGYCDYASKMFPKAYLFIAPIVWAASFSFVVWIIASILAIIGFYVQVGAISYISAFLLLNLPGIFAAIAIIGYILVAVCFALGLAYFGLPGRKSGCCG